ncbi:hypothetical protein L1987_37263 [Smallanthus sonchifolius]|uniref:Uncharacterized protein n=1 Tax=Smallanthus sonchifolius TaxID=185202 RepID=A0ACB9HHN4_9ASTR|nr:hypothetical protein L1987_37263 [Smallanthus sonchifolius]
MMMSMHYSVKGSVYIINITGCIMTNDERVKSKWDRQPSICFPRPSKIIDTDYQDVPFVTLMDILTYPDVIAKFMCVVRVVATLPAHPRDFRAPCGTYRLRLTLEDPTARIHAYIYAEDGVKFFGGYPLIDKMVKMHNALLGVEETDDADSNEKLTKHIEIDLHFKHGMSHASCLLHVDFSSANKSSFNRTAVMFQALCRYYNST